MIDDPFQFPQVAGRHSSRRSLTVTGTLEKSMETAGLIDIKTWVCKVSIGPRDGQIYFKEDYNNCKCPPVTR